MKIAINANYYVLFNVNDTACIVEAIFTGDSLPSLDGTENYLFRHSVTKKLYAFTMKQLLTFEPLNDKSKVTKHQSIEVKAQDGGFISPFNCVK